VPMLEPCSVSAPEVVPMYTRIPIAVLGMPLTGVATVSSTVPERLVIVSGLFSVS
jgi:hypothetical protein